MKKIISLSCVVLSAVFLMTGCQSNTPTPPAAANVAAPAPPTAPTSPTVAVAPPATPAVPTPAAVHGQILRIKAGASSPVTDTEGNVWLPDQGFDGGDVVERPGIEIANTKDPMIYQSEHYSMDSFTCKVPNGDYDVKLHFAETYDGITGPGQRVFSFSLGGQDFKDFDVYKMAGGPLRAYVQDVKVTVSDGQLIIKFTSNVENPQINGIEIIPQN